MGDNESDIKVIGVDWSDLTDPRTFIGRMAKEHREQPNKDYFHERLCAEFAAMEEPPRWTFKLVGRFEPSPALQMLVEKYRTEYADAAYKSNSRIYLAHAAADKKPNSDVEIVMLDEAEEAL
jgi:hypothetical protein